MEFGSAPEPVRQRPEGQCWRQKTRLKTWPQRYARVEGEYPLPAAANALVEMFSLVPLLSDARDWRIRTPLFRLLRLH